MIKKAELASMDIKTFDDLVEANDRNALALVTSHDILSKGLNIVNTKLGVLTATVLIFGIAFYAFNEINEARITKLERELAEMKAKDEGKARRTNYNHTYTLLRDC